MALAFSILAGIGAAYIVGVLSKTLQSIYWHFRRRQLKEQQG